MAAGLGYFSDACSAVVLSMLAGTRGAGAVALHFVGRKVRKLAIGPSRG